MQNYPPPVTGVRFSIGGAMRFAWAGSCLKLSASGLLRVFFYFLTPLLLFYGNGYDKRYIEKLPKREYEVE